MAIHDFDSVFTHIGGFGQYQMLLFGVISYMCTLLAFVYLGQIFMTLTPPHWCRPSPYDLDLLDLTSEEVKRLTIPIDPDTKEFSECSRYDVDINQILQSNTSTGANSTWNITTCTYGWTYNYSFYYPTITSQLNWVCDEDWKPAFTQSMFFVGSLLGVPILGWAADKWGRLPIIVSTNVLGGVMGIASAFATSFAIFTTFRFIVGMTFDTHFIVAYILVMEYVPSEYRTVMGNVPIMIFLTGAMCAMPWIAYGLGNWTYYTIAIHSPQFFCLIFIWILPESARWLLSQGRLDDTMKIIKTAAKLNNKTLSPEFIQEFKEYGEKQALDDNTNVSVFDLLKTPVLRMRFFILCVMWITITLVYDGYMRNTENIGYNVFISFTVLGFVELPADFLTIVSMEWLGRRHTTVVTLVLSGVTGMLITAVPQAEENVIFGLAICGRFLITMSINVGQQYIVEILPTVARSSGSGCVHTLGCAAAFLSPSIVYLSKYGHYLPYLILGVVSIVGGLICALLPETKNEKLPDSLGDGETYFTGQPCCYNPCSGRKKMKITPINEVIPDTRV